MDTLFSMKVFRLVVESGGFSRAAQRLDISPAMASKHVAHLEKTLSAKLLYRNSRHVRLTDTGAEYYRECVHALEILAAAAQKAGGGLDKPQGRLRITMPQWFADRRVAAWMAEYRQRYPEVVLDLSFDNRRCDLVAEGLDVALRVSVHTEPEWIVRPLGEIAFYLYASSDYLARYGTPDTPEALSKHPAVVPSYSDLAWVKLRPPQGEASTLALCEALRCDNTMMTAKLIGAGCGIGFLPEWCAEGLVRLLPDYTLMRIPLYAVYADRAFLSAKIRSFIDFMVEKTADHAHAVKR